MNQLKVSNGIIIWKNKQKCLVQFACNKALKQSQVIFLNKPKPNLI